MTFFDSVFGDRLNLILKNIKREFDLRKLSYKSIDTARFNLQSLNHIYPLSLRQKNDWLVALNEVLVVLKKNDFNENSVRAANIYFDKLNQYISILCKYYQFQCESMDALKKLCEKKHDMGLNYRDDENAMLQIKERLAQAKIPTAQDVEFAKRYAGVCKQRLADCTELNSFFNMLMLLKNLHEKIILFYHKNKLEFNYIVKLNNCMKKENYSHLSTVSLDDLAKIRSYIKQTNDCFVYLKSGNPPKNNVDLINTYYVALSDILFKLMKTKDPILKIA